MVFTNHHPTGPDPAWSSAMVDSVPVRCPACRREHAFTPATFPCSCGVPLTVPVLRGGVPTQVTQRTWKDSWVTLRCASCGRSDDWPQPELGCSCGAVIRLPVDPAAARRGPADRAAADPTSGPGAGTVTWPRPTAAPRPLRRPPFQPVTIRTGQDAVSAAAQYLTWLGFTHVVVTDDRSVAGADLRGDGLLARVDASTQGTPLRDVETLWLNCLNEDATGAFFSLAGYTREARARADQVTVPLFVMDLTGTPQPVNDAANRLIRSTPQHEPGPA